MVTWATAGLPSTIKKMTRVMLVFKEGSEVPKQPGGKNQVKVNLWPLPKLVVLSWLSGEASGWDMEQIPPESVS